MKDVIRGYMSKMSVDPKVLMNFPSELRRNLSDIFA